MPCGAAWLANALLELGLAIDNLWGFDTRAEWSIEPNQSRRYVAEHGPWRQTLAALQPGRVFPAPIGPQVSFSHQLPHELPTAEQRILIVRDPRDALHSEWQRQRRNSGYQADFSEFLSSPFFDTPLSQRDYLFSHLSQWLDAWQAQSPPCLLVRFEDFKQQPTASLDRITRWLGLGFEVPALQAACEASDVRHLQRIEREIEQQQHSSRQFNRRGQAFEWRSQWQPDWHQAFGTDWRPMLDRLRYPSHATDFSRGRQAQ